MNDFPTSRSKQAMFVGVASARMWRSGLTIPEITRRLRELGYPPKDAQRLADDGVKLAEKFASKIGIGRVPGAPRVFLSHSHADRQGASYIEGILEQNGAQTFLDQHRITPGEKLADRLLMGLFWCDYLLLFWSDSARRSEFVEWEWTRAAKLVKTIVPYRVDSTPLPDPLSRLVFIDASHDQAHGHAKLLGTILGREWKPPDPSTLFPGTWDAVVSVMGFGEAEYKLQLRADGQVSGSGSITNAGLLGGGLRELGLGHLSNLKIPVAGSWTYDDREKMLELEVTATFMGQRNSDVVRIQTTGEESGWITGTTLGGLPWRLRRER